MNNKLFVGGLSWNTTNETLAAAFNQYGQTTECKVITDKFTGKSKGFGFVTFTSADDASASLEGLNNQMLDGRTIKVDFATERPSR
ncbi:MAG: RNA recognition motif domain-containing protein [Bacteriovoracaceae bacterium]